MTGLLGGRRYKLCHQCSKLAYIWGINITALRLEGKDKGSSALVSCGRGVHVHVCVRARK